MLPIVHGGSVGLKKKYLTRLGGASKLLTALGATEPSAGSDLLAMKSRAVREGDHYVLNGRKCFITNGSVADLVVVYACTDPGRKSKGLSAFVVEKGTPGLSYGRNESKMGVRGSINSELFFDDMKVPAGNRIGEEGDGFANLMKTLSMNRIFCAAQAVGIAQGALLGGMAKIFASDTAMQVTTDAVQVLGGYGYMKDHSVERMMRDAKLTQIYTGTNQIPRLVTGRALLLS